MSTSNFKSIGAQGLIMPCPLLLVGSYLKENKQGLETRKPNIMTAAWGTICSHQPPAMLVAIRSTRATHQAILETQAFTVSIPDTKMLAEADFAGICSGQVENKFASTGFTSVTAEHVDAPYVGECPIVLEMKLMQTHETGTHTLFVGEIMDVKVKEHCFNNGVLDPHLLNVACYLPLLQEYWSLGSFQAKAFGVGKTITPR